MLDPGIQPARSCCYRLSVRPSNRPARTRCSADCVGSVAHRSSSSSSGLGWRSRSSEQAHRACVVWSSSRIHAAQQWPGFHPYRTRGSLDPPRRRCGARRVRCRTVAQTSHRRTGATLGTGLAGRPLGTTRSLRHLRAHSVLVRLPQIRARVSSWQHRIPSPRAAVKLGASHTLVKHFPAVQMLRGPR